MSVGQIFARIMKIGVDQVLFVAFFAVCVLVAALSCATHHYWVTSVIGRMIDVHVFNDATKMYFEALMWTLVLTTIQFYKYHISTLSLYDAITIEGADVWSRSRHFLLQAGLSAVTLNSALTIFVTIFQSIYLTEIMDRHNVDVSEIINEYLSWLNLNNLIFCFVAMDVIILLMNRNFSACEGCVGERKAKLESERIGLHSSIAAGVLLCLIQILFVSMYANHDTQYVSSNNLRVDAGRVAPLWLMIFLQLFYVVADLQVRAKSKGSHQLIGAAQNLAAQPTVECTPRKGY